MAEIISPPPPVPGFKLRQVLGWAAAFILLTAAWLLLLAVTQPIRPNFNGVAAVLTTLAPPPLMTLLAWIFMRAPQPSGLAANVLNDSAQAATGSPGAPIYSALRFRIAAHSALTPFGNAFETIEGTQGKKKVFQVDQTLRIPGGFPVHAAMVANMPLEQVGYPSGTRSMPARIAAMLAYLLNELHQQQDHIASVTDMPCVVWLLTPPLLEYADTQKAFIAAWSNSPWREMQYELHLLPGEPGAGYALIEALQRDIEQSRAPLALLLAADSMLERERLTPLIELEQVFSDAAANGFIPGEGGAGLLLLHPEHSPVHMLHDACRLGPAVRIAGAPQKNRRDAELASLPTALSAAMVAQGADASSIGAVVSAADHRVAGMVAATAAMTRHVPELNPLDDRISPMQYCGWFGSATDLVHLALGAELATLQTMTVAVLSSSADKADALLILPPPA